MIIVTFDSLIKQIKEKISGICSNIGTKQPLPTEYTSTGKVITKNIVSNKLYVNFQLQPQSSLKKLYTEVSDDIMEQELERYLTANGVWFSDKEYKLGTRDLLNILSVVSNFCVKHIKFIVAPLFDHLEPTYIVYFSDKLLNDSDFMNVATLKTDNINMIDPKIDTTIKSEEQKEMNYRNDIIVANDVNNLL